MRKTFFLISIFFILTSDVFAESWEDKFGKICSSTDASMSMTVEELEEKVKGCDNLMEEIQASSKENKKIYIFRLKKCRKFYDYMLVFKKEQEEGE